MSIESSYCLGCNHLFPLEELSSCCRICSKCEQNSSHQTIISADYCADCKRLFPVQELSEELSIGRRLCSRCQEYREFLDFIENYERSYYGEL